MFGAASTKFHYKAHSPILNKIQVVSDPAIQLYAIHKHMLR